MTTCVTTPTNAAPMNTRSATSSRASTARRSHPGQPRDLPAAPTNTRSAPSGHASSTRRGHSRKPCRPCPSTTRTARRRATRRASPPSDDLVVRSERLLSDAAPPPVTWSDGRQRRRTLRHPATPANFVSSQFPSTFANRVPVCASRSHRRFSSTFASSAPVTNVDEKRRWVQAGGAKKTSVGGHAPTSAAAMRHTATGWAPVLAMRIRTTAMTASEMPTPSVTMSRSASEILRCSWFIVHLSPADLAFSRTPPRPCAPTSPELIILTLSGRLTEFPDIASRHADPTATRPAKAPPAPVMAGQSLTGRHTHP